MHRVLGVCLMLAATSAAAPSLGAQDAASWSVVQPEKALAGTSASAVRETRWRTTRPPGGTYDQVELHRYRGASPATAVLLYLPGTNMNAEPALRDEDHNLWLFLAARGVDVYALDYRTRFVPPSGVTDFAFMRGWDMATFVSDARAAAAKARAESGLPRLFVAGFSRGVNLAYAFALAEPREGLAGLIALDGYFKSHAPKGQFDRAAALKAVVDKGAFASDVSGPKGWERRAALMKAAAEAGPASSDKYETAGDELADVLYSAWRPGGLANAKEGKSTASVLARLLAGYDRYYPAVQDVDGRAIADYADDPATPVDDGWGKLEAPVLYFGATNMGVEWVLNGIASAGGAGSPDVTLNVLENYGHLDVIAGDQARRDVYEPTLAWIRKRAGS